MKKENEQLPDLISPAMIVVQSYSSKTFEPERAKASCGESCLIPGGRQHWVWVVKQKDGGV